MSRHRTQWSEDHGADGLRGKFSVYKTANGCQAPDSNVVSYDARERIGADDEFIFVLRPESDEAAWQALNLYAQVAQRRAPKLAYDIRTQLTRIYRNQEDPPS